MNTPFRTAAGFRERLRRRQSAIKSLVCVGLDPQLNKIPHAIRSATYDDATAVFLWMQAIVDATAPMASMYKPQFAYWLAIPGGLEALRKLIAYIHFRYPDIVVFMDCKVGDIDRTQAQYGEAHLALAEADGMNYNPYMGRDTLKSLIDPGRPGRALVGLGRTSNSEAWEVQDAVMSDGSRVWQLMLKKILQWSEELGVLDDAGVVMGAAHKDPTDPDVIFRGHLLAARAMVGDKLWFLIPGIGTQGGFVKETVLAAYSGRGSIAVNSSSGITNVSMEHDFAEAAGKAARDLANMLEAAIPA